MFCDICRGIPYDDLPELPLEFCVSTKPFDGILSFTIDKLTHHQAGDLDFGYHHHQGLEALQSSATTCDLCALLLGEVLEVRDAFERARKDALFVYYKRDRASPNYSLRLTKRNDAGQGFMMWSLTSEPGVTTVYLVAAIGLCVDDKSSKSIKIPGRPVEGFSGSPKSLNRALGWIKNCDSFHSCRPDSPIPSMRLIDVGTSMHEGLRLVESTPGSRGKYITLSHCWGISRHFTTTKATIQARKECIDFQELPKTFQDAVEVTRYLGIRYLWIDSLCICQDDVREWERESANMGSIYSNAYLCISASRAAEDEDGCFSERSTRQYVSIQSGYMGSIYHGALAFTLRAEKAAWSEEWHSFRGEPLNKRGWALQERFLAPRMLHFASDQMYFECLEEFKSEDGYQWKDRHHKLEFGRNPEPDNRRQDLYKGSPNWYRLVEEYCMKQLSFPSDKLPALSGLAHQFERAVTRDKYVAGLWKESLLEGICWQSVASSRLDLSIPAYRAPSWSWASYDGPVAFVGYLGEPPSGTERKIRELWKPLATILDAKVKLKGENPYGEIESGYLKLRAPLEPVFVSEEPEHDWKVVPHQRNVRVCLNGGDSYGHYTIFDLPTKDRDCVRQMNLHVLFLLSRKQPDEDETTYQALLVVPAEAKGEHRRVGKIIMTSKSVQSCAWVKEERHSLPITTLV